MRFTIDDLRLTRVVRLAFSRITHHASRITFHAPVAPKSDEGGSRSTLHAPRSTRSAAFTLIELMVAVTLMSLIVLGLLTMFNQTQKAFRASMTQTDVLESGRILTDMISRELGQMAASDRTAFTNNANFLTQVSSAFNPPFLQGMPGTSLAAGKQDQRTNIVQRLFFLTQSNQNWVGIGYQVLADYPNAGVGTLYRFSTNHNNYTATNITAEFLNAPLLRLNRMADGVVHFRLRAFSTNGYPIQWDGNTGLIPKFRANAFTNFSSFSPIVKNTRAINSIPGAADVVDYCFMSNALPAYVELEIGILEPHILDRFKGIGGNSGGVTPSATLVAAQQRYLSNHVAQVHLFRQRIPIRTVDFSAYQ